MRNRKEDFTRWDDITPVERTSIETAMDDTITATKICELMKELKVDEVLSTINSMRDMKPEVADLDMQEAVTFSIFTVCLLTRALPEMTLFQIANTIRDYLGIRQEHTKVPDKGPAHWNIGIIGSIFSEFLQWSPVSLRYRETYVAFGKIDKDFLLCMKAILWESPDILTRKDNAIDRPTIASSQWSLHPSVARAVDRARSMRNKRNKGQSI